MVNFAGNLTVESFVDIGGNVSKPSKPIAGTTQMVEIHVTRLYLVSKSVSRLPFNLEDASRSEADFHNPPEGKQPVRVKLDTRLNNRVLDLQTPASSSIFRIESKVMALFSKFLLKEGFIWVQTPKILFGESEGGAKVFKMRYFEEDACLAQAPQVHKSMCISACFKKIFIIGAKYRAQHSNTHRHVCEFTGLDVEMEIVRHYAEVMDLVDMLFVEIFDELNKTYCVELDTIKAQYPFEDLKYCKKTVRITFEEGIQMLKDAGKELDPLGDLNLENERKLGELVRERFDTDFFILHRYPIGARPFFHMSCHDDARYNCSFDVFIRGEEVVSGAQRVHDADMLKERVKEAKITGGDKTLESYIESLR
ncbi:hypothetical protein OROMI_013528 [Orobanche minor]